MSTLKRLWLACGLAALAYTQGRAATVEEVAALTGPNRQAELEAGARAEGTVTLYTSMILDQAARPLADAFQKRYPFIKVRLYQATGDGLLQKVIAEARAGKPVASLIEAVGIDQAARQAGLLVPFHSASADEMPANRKDPAGYWAASRINYFGLAYNTEMVKPQDLPKTWDDLLDPKWKGKLVVCSEFLGGPLLVTATQARLGGDAGLAFLKRLAAQNVAVVNANNRVAVDRVISGEYAMSLDAYIHHPVISAEQGAPVAPLLLAPVTTTYGSVLLPKNAPNPYAAMLLLDYILSKEGQQVLAKALYFPARPDVAPAPALQGVVPAARGLTELVLTPEQIGAANGSSQDIFGRLFK